MLESLPAVRMGSVSTRFRMLGPLRIWDGAAWAPVRAAQQRVVLSVLLIEAGRVVTADRLVNEIWGERPPRSATSVLQGYVMRLRRTLGGGTHGPVATRGNGYEVMVDDDDLDTREFDRLVAAGRSALAGGDLVAAAAQLAQGLALWHGQALADVPPGPTVTAHASQLEQGWLTATEDHLGVRLELGEHAAVVGELHRLVSEHPLSERLWGHLMRALYRCGRRGEALAAFQRARTVLTTELGLEPSKELHDLQRAILTDGHQPITVPPAAEPASDRVTPAHLPTGAMGFSGRADQLRRLDQLLAEARQAPRAVISAITGAAGIGKTTLAVQWAHQVADRFPDGHLFVNLRGFDPTGSAMPPAEAIRTFLDALQVPPQRIPAGLAGQVGLYRSLLADRRMLIVLDNARDPEHVRPLLPGSSGCLVLITSRNQLTGLVATDGAQPVKLGLLSAADARQLLGRRLGTDRVAAEPVAVDEVISRCAGLPLALALVAARVATRPELGMGAIADELRDGLDAFATGDGATDLRAVFSGSYHALSTAAQRLFRLLSIHPGPEVAACAAASLAGTPAAQAKPVLAELTRANLLTEPARDRYALHDLLRAYATELADTMDDQAERDAACRRLLDHYLHTAHAARRHLDRHVDPIVLDPPEAGVTPEHLASREQALTWLATERPVLIGCVVRAGGGSDVKLWQLEWSIGQFLEWQGHWHNCATIAAVALAAAQRIGDRHMQAHSHDSLGLACMRVGRIGDARQQFEAAGRLFHEAGDRIGEAHVHHRLGMLLGDGRPQEALSHLRRALDLYRQLGSRPGEALCLNKIGWRLAEFGEHRQALDHCQRALAILVEIGDHHAEGVVWDSIGYAHHHLADHRQAVDCYERAVALHRKFGDRHHEAETLDHLGDTHHAADRGDEARTAWRDALAIFDGLGHPDADDVRSKLDAAADRQAPEVTR